MSLEELELLQERRRRLLNLTLTCLVALALIALGACGPADVEIADGNVVSGDPTADEQIEPVRIPPPERLVLPTTTTTTAHVHPAPTTSAVPLLEVAEEPVSQDVTPVAPAPTHSGDSFAALAACESTGDRDGVEPHNINPAAVNPTGKYRGAFQFDATTWASVGGTGDPAAQSYAEQLHRAQILQSRRGWGPWPHCSRVLGLG